MLFNSLAFAIFMPIVFILYWALPHRFRWILLLIASYYFYLCFDIKFIILLFFTTALSYGSALLLEKEETKAKKKVILIISIIICIGILFFFKYFNFAVESVEKLMSLFAIKLSPLTLSILLPAGISFYIFQTVSYIIDVYRGDIKAEHHFGYYAVFVSFFPKLVAGPIERAKNFIPQLKEKRKFNYAQATYGLKLMVWGFFKKLLIADTLAVYVNKIFDEPREYRGFALLLAAIFFTIQIYCDFSGYSDIAIGASKLLGINLMDNFKSPYFSQSVKEFWSRWHISLSTWFRDYVYIPLGGNRVGKVRHIFNLIITFLVSGLWHGANWTFVAWGGIHGIAQAAENLIIPKEKYKSKGLLKWIRIIAVFIFAMFAWIFFTSNSISDAFYVIGNMFTGIATPIMYLRSGVADIGLGGENAIYLIVSMIILIIFDYISSKKDVLVSISNKKVVIRWIIYVLIILWIVMNIPLNNSTEFLYFQF